MGRENQASVDIFSGNTNFNLKELYIMTVRTIRECITKINELSDNAVVYAKRINGQFGSDSETILLELTEEEEGLKVDAIAQMKCPGFDYFLEVLLIKEVLEDEHTADLSQQIESVIQYAEYDA
ncbi:hypothetical protein SAMN02745146_2646 [Hymenobacter daecheongensis DSM 21074]|uniref:Uncharacterized protein n=1 Tax=Hymenobacter daecheongensis DSM 21074 TaxID=1121955 RepID=A0A1M6HUD9_9BACT|nr:hypothetical protein [Hymenobacter daecheongensis]SHJ25839.1 hypothetical protein SAMN02745146_2646 [Hymenobacter daecheongensis DSM 21074]